MKRSFPGRVLTLAAALGLSATAANAGHRPGAPLKLPPIKPAEAEYRRQLRPYAECVVGQANAELAVFLNEGIGGRGAADRAKRLAASAPGCVRPRGKSGAEVLLLRGAIFEALYRRDFGAGDPPAGLAEVVPAVHGGKPSSDPTFATMLSGVFAVFDCAVRKDPRRVAEMLRHPPESEQETAAFTGLAPALAQCQPGRERIAFTASFARPYVSEILYTLSLAHRASGAGAAR
ncbi:MAG TPA: hypothetical protein VD846_04615 [Allosphingosinicella sp.]|nr:hypothetical protein [Allosphingosinicella sp.]